jgi:ubiquinone/menaquinone biosynthesis C-methylase UbiE
MKKMIEEYISSSEFQTCYEKLYGLRLRIARDLPLRPKTHILDLATGSGFFAIEVAKLDRTLHITGIDISPSDIRDARKNIKGQGLNERVEILDMDATEMKFHPEQFDMAINFTGLEDIHMTRGRTGVQKTFVEVSRVLKPESFFCFVVMSPEEMDTQAQKIEVALFSYVCDATWLPAREYEKMLQQANFRLIRKRSYYTGKKLTPEQTKVEIEFTCKTDPEIYGISTPPFEEIWAKFGPDIEKHGMGYYGKVILFIAQKAGELR